MYARVWILERVFSTALQFYYILHREEKGVHLRDFEVKYGYFFPLVI